ncbi:RNA polymerase sigma factor [Spirillospora sp. NPDC047279]|uniref:RNA polymerase sigma factor n=1 Tax=Spirillospora sp. NPDC047279 TaxID=3155478 RepID=UPI0033F88362
MLTEPLEADAAPEGESDAAVVRGSLSRPERFAAVFDRHSDEIYRYVARRLGPETAEDVVAETFLTAFRKRGGYDLDRPDARPWLYGIATNLVRAHRRAEVRRNRALARGHDPATAESFDERSVARLTAERLQPRLAAALNRLSAGERDLLMLIAWADLTYEEAAHALGVPVGTVRSRLHRVRTKVRRALGGVDPMTTNEESLA